MSYNAPPNSTSDCSQEARAAVEASGAELRQSGVVLPKPIIRSDAVEDKRQGLIPVWTSVASAWCGSLATLGAIALPVIGKWRRASAAVQKGHWLSGDLWAPFPLYFALAAIVLGMAVLWQTRHRQKAYPAIEINQRAQAWVGSVLGMIAIALIYLYAIAYVAWRAL